MTFFAMPYTIILVTEKPFAAEVVQSMRAAFSEQSGFVFRAVEKYTSRQDMLAAIKDADAVIVRSDVVDTAFLDATPNLKLIVRAGSGYDTIDLDAASARRVVVMNTPGQNSNAVAELVFGLLIYQSRKRYSGDVGFELRGKILGLYGFGFVGKCVATIARGFGMTVTAYDPFVDAALMKQLDVKRVDDPIEVFKSDFVSIHVPLTPQTKESIGRTYLANLKKNGVVVNTARAEVVNERELGEFLASRPDASYVADVAPINASSISAGFGASATGKLESQMYVTTKKVGAQTVESNNNCGPAAVSQIVKFFLHGDTKHQVNKFSNL